MKKIISLALVLVMVLALCACGAPKTVVDDSLSYCIVDTNAKSVTIKCQVNGKYFNESTRHGIVFSEGSNGEKAILRGLVSEKDFYAALIGLGAVPGDNLTLPMEPGLFVEGEELDITISWDGSKGEIPFENIVKTGNGKPYTMDCRFGGNIINATNKFTGCIFCLDSCAVGITSNADYATCVVEGTKTEQFYGNADILPADGTIVNVTFTRLG